MNICTIFFHSRPSSYGWGLFLVCTLCALLTCAPAQAANKKKAATNATAKTEAPLQNAQSEAAAAYAQGEYTKAHELWQQLADKGDPKAMNNLGVVYDKGQGVTQDPALAVFWFLRSAKAGHAAGMSNLGRLLEQGRGVPKDLTQAASWFRQAADKGLAEAQYNLAVMYENGQGLDKNDREAAAWYSRAAAQNQVDAQSRLGQMYRDGRGVKQNATRAVLLLYGASMEGKREAIEALEGMASDPQFKSKAAPTQQPSAVLFGLPLEQTSRTALREVLRSSKVPVVREEDGYICDVYNVRTVIPGASEMAACYGPGPSQPLGFVKIDYPAPTKGQAEKISNSLKTMLVERFGPPSAAEGQGSTLWNLGKVIVATQYSSTTKEIGLMYMVPQVYHLTRQQ
ncbi:MAG: tetratricopeptide repeat protein [Desulfovibrionaceae bacterium]